jgi:surface antigen
MIELVVFGLAPELKLSPLLTTVTEQTVQVEPPPEPITVINDPNNCEPAMYWAKEAPYYCIPKPTERRSESVIPSSGTGTPVSTKKAVRTPQNWFEAGSCTYGAQQLAPWVGRWKNAKTWDDMARKDGHTVSSIPIVGAVFVDNGGRYGHVGVVLDVQGSMVTVKDMNYHDKWEWTVRTVNSSKYVYIYP